VHRIIEERKKAMRAVLIDPVARSFTEVEYDGDYKSIYKHLECDLFDVVFTEFGDVYVDDEGLLKPDQKFFYLEGMSQPLAGRGLVFGLVDDDGNTTPATVSIEELELNVKFLTPQKVMELFS
jgi:hypothetical protein